jgi:cysteine desulfurase family protein (TIGR01976 family)
MTSGDRALPVIELRDEFPALAAAGRFVFFDNAAGAQVPRRALDAVADHLVARNVQRGGSYGRSREVDAMLARARASVADLVNAASPDEIAFGLNATSFIRTISLAVGQTLDNRPEIIVSDLDHEANVATWLALAPTGARIVWWRAGADGRLHVEDLDRLLTSATRLVACTLASNAIGTRVEVAGVSERAHAAGAEVFVDAVHYAPHGPIDVAAIGCDYLVCSGYKIFAPHMGFAWCRPAAIDRLPTFREDFIPDRMPDKLEAGTYAYENVAGMDAAVEYLADLGRRIGNDSPSRRAAIRTAMEAIARYESGLCEAMLDALASVPGATIHGVADRARLEHRVPTIAFSIDGIPPAAVAEHLDGRGIAVRSGHMYAPRLMNRLGTPQGVVRASLVHYNTLDEVERFREALAELVAAGTPYRPPAGGRSAVLR